MQSVSVAALQMGVITTCRLDEGTAFGPIPPTMTLADPIVLIGHRTCDTLPDIHTVKVRSTLYMAINLSRTEISEVPDVHGH